MKKVKFNWAVFNTETGFRLTEYNTHTMAIWARGMILHDQPELRGKIEVKHKNKQKLSLLYYLELLKEVQPGL